MKSVKETVYEYIQQEIYRNTDIKFGIETKQVANALGMQRSNVSSVLNTLVKEGRLTKTTTRPVYYNLSQRAPFKVEEHSFVKLIGHNGSLRNSIQLAKAAILYPQKSLNILLSSKTGCGTTFFASLMLQFAKENQVLSNKAPYININCRHYAKNISVLTDELFGINDDLEKSCFFRAKGGLLFIDNVDLLDAKQLSRLFLYLEQGILYSEDKSKSIDCKDVFLVLACSPESGLQINRMVPVTIELPELKDRPLKERFALINHFFSIEATSANRSIQVTAESMQALLLHDFVYNIKELKIEIKAACANAFVRVVNETKQDICVCVSDFKGDIKRSLLKLKDKVEEIDLLLEKRDIIFYDENTGYQNQYKEHRVDGIYIQIKKQYDELINLGVNNTSLESVMNSYIHNLFKKYRHSNSFNDIRNLEQLSKIVDQRVINLVSNFFNTIKKELKRDFKSNVFYGLCLHINSLLILNSNKQRVNNDQIVSIIQEYPKEYAASVQFAMVLNTELNLDLPIHEIVLIAMFLIKPNEDTSNTPVLLYIMHGNTTASSLRDVTNSLTHCHNAYSYDLPLHMEPSQALEEIRTLILEIDNGQGIIVIYDMGSIKTMMETILEEIDVKIRCINIPVTLIGIDIARKCSMETDIDYVYHMANLDIKNMYDKEEKRNSVIITLCHTGEGGAVQLKRYIDQYSKLAMKTIALSISSRDELLKEIFALKKIYHIHSFVGTYDPKILGIPFISIAKVFENTKEDLDRILMFEPTSSRSFNYNEVYKYLDEQFKYASIPKMKTVLPSVMDTLNIYYVMNEDQHVGLFMHLACLIEKLLEGEVVVKNNEKNKIISVFEDDYRILSKTLKPLEKAFKVIIDDHEIANIIMILKEM